MRARACVRTHANTNYATTPSWNGHFAILLFEMLLFLFWCCVSHVKLMMVNDSIDFDLLVVFFLSLSLTFYLCFSSEIFTLYIGARAHTAHVRSHTHIIIQFISSIHTTFGVCACVIKLTLVS